MNGLLGQRKVHTVRLWTACCLEGYLQCMTSTADKSNHVLGTLTRGLTLETAPSAKEKQYLEIPTSL